MGMVIAPTRFWLIRLATSALVLMALAHPVQAQSAWVPSDLGALGAENSAANDINGAGQIVGHNYSDSPELPAVAFLWTPASGMVNLGTLPNFGPQSEATAINATGQVVGWSGRQTLPRAFSWSAAGGMIDLGTLGGSFSAAQAVNRAGQVVGWSNPDDVDPIAFHTFLWTAATGMVDLGTLGGTSSFAYDINDAGQLVGQDTSGSGITHAILWTVAGGLRDLGTLGGTYSLASAINNAGQVVGESTTVSGVTHAFRWSEVSGMVDLGTLGGSSSSAADINTAGQVVGLEPDRQRRDPRVPVDGGRGADRPWGARRQRGVRVGRDQHQ